MDKNCSNCASSKKCFYRGISNPCEIWKPNKSHGRLRKLAKKVVGKPLSMMEGQFVESAITLEFFSPKQASWLRSIAARYEVNL